METQTHPCPACSGKGQFMAHHNTGADSSGHYWEDVNCLLCKGVGVIDQDRMDKYLWGQRMKKIRMELGISLMDLSRRTGFSSAQISAFEWGRD